MSLPSPVTTAAGAVVGTSGITYPTWGQQAIEWLGNSWTWIIQFGGFVVLVLTAVKLILEIRKLLQRDKER